ncbi:putative Tetratricopeptide repeat protein 1 [Hypsibius exemplaris]|uniref:Tetratricopeptide repeat protein 1 n=1 Tax=Hypsibius exemplaris TaxID=2072580 RepID=A0A1W0XDC7_HYPEX|nr:putative Tetratricopeptide repeat protein 1 [Hypsibius exemplaris]
MEHDGGKEVGKQNVERLSEESAAVVEEGETAPEVEEAHAPEEETFSAKPKSLERSLEFKKSGNTKFGDNAFQGAFEDYTAAIDLCPDDDAHHKSVLLSNRAAAILKLGEKEHYESAVADCTAAIELDQDNNKAVLRRAMLHEVMENYEDAMEDYKALLEKNPQTTYAKEAVKRLPKLIEEKNEKMKVEMMDKLKDLGNLVLKPFGLSTDNFKMEPQASGGYSVKFEPSKKK